MANRIVIDDNSKEYEVVNRQGVVLGTFLINPTDFNIAARAEEAIGHIEQIMSGVEENQEADDADALEELKKAGEDAKREIDYIFNANASETFFAKVNPFSLVDGKFYIENVISAVQAVIKKEFNAEINRSRARISKYTEKYTGMPGKYPSMPGENRESRRSEKKKKKKKKQKKNREGNRNEGGTPQESVEVSESTEPGIVETAARTGA